MRDLATFAPRWSFRRRTTSPLDARAPGPPVPVLSDWDPGYSLYTDRQHATTFAQSGAGIVTRELQANGRYAGVFPGTGCLVAPSSPFAALASLSGGASCYVVSQRTDAGSGQDGLAWIDDDDGTTGNANQIGLTHNGPGTSASALVYDPAGGVTSDGQTCTLAGLQVFSGHFTLTAREMRVDGTGSAEASGTSRAPVDLARMTIGGYTLFSAGAPIGLYTGKIYRVIWAEGAYSAAVLAYLAALYQ